MRGGIWIGVRNWDGGVGERGCTGTGDFLEGSGGLIFAM